MPRGRPVDSASRARVVDLARQGLGRNEIAAQTGVAAASVTKIVADAGLSFDRSATKAAVEARSIDAKAKRAELMIGLLDDAQKMRDRLFAPTEYIDHGGRDFDEARWTQDEPNHADKLKLMQAATYAIDRSLRLDAHDSDEHGLSAVDTWLRDMLGN